MDDRQFRQLLQELGLSWKGYRRVRKGVMKRITRHMQQLGCRHMAAYLLELERGAWARRECDRLMTVSISRFFRDRRLWEVLEKEVLPEIIKKGERKVRVWSAGCASGEEVYTLKMLWDRLKGLLAPLPDLEILATDLNPAYLRRAQAGVYPPSSLKEVPEEERQTHFEAGSYPNLYAVKASLKKDVIWKEHNLLSGPPGPAFHLILMRNNLLTYYERAQKISALNRVKGSLSPGGFLILGSHEELPFEPRDLIPLDACSFVFRRQGGGS
jgi:chemotaxis protein methyltransferase CheR